MARTRGGEHRGKGGRQGRGWDGNSIPSNQTPSYVRLTNVSALLSLRSPSPTISCPFLRFLLPLERMDWRGIDCTRLSAATEMLRKSARAKKTQRLFATSELNDAI